MSPSAPMPEPTAEWQALIADLERQLSNKVRLRERLKSKLTLAEPGEQARLEIQIENLEEEIRGLKGELDELRQPGPGVVITRVRPLPDAPFLVPFVHNPDFVGRDEDLTLLHNMIAAGGSPVGIRPTGLVGLGGIGKTQLAVEYAHTHRADYPGGVYWVNAINPLLGELAHLAEQLGLAGIDTPRDRAVQAVWQYLDARPEALVIFDNMVEPKTLNQVVVPGLTPANLRCRTLFTTRHRDIPRNLQSFEVKVLPELAAMSLLLRARPEVLQEQHPDWGQARVLCAYLGWLPLAVELAAAYLGAYPDVSVRDYLERLRVEGRLATIDDTEITAADLPTRYHEIAALVSQDLAVQHHIAVKATLETQWQRLEDEDARLLFRVAGQFPEASWIPIARLGVLAGVATAAGNGRPSPLGYALRKLHAISLIEELSGEQLRLHPLVREFAAGLGNNDLRQGIIRCVLRAYESFANLEAQVAARGIASVLDDLRMGLALCRASGDEIKARRLRNLEHPLDREAHALRNWDPNVRSVLFAQQVHKRTVELGVASLVSIDVYRRLVSQGQPYLTLRWCVNNESPALERTLAGHGAGVLAVAVTPDGRRAISASNDHTLKIWDMTSGLEEHTLVGHNGWVRAVALTPDGRRIVSASDDHTLKIWDLASGREERTIAGHSAIVRSVSVTADGRRIVCASDDRTIGVWDLFSGQKALSLTGHTDRVLAAAITPDGHNVVSASNDRTLKVWDLTSGQEKCTLIRHNDNVCAVAVTSDGRHAISASVDHTLKVWDLTSCQEEFTLTGHLNWVNGVAAMPDGRRAISASSDRSLKIWDLTNKQLEHTLTGHGDKVRAVAVTPDGRWAISASDDRTLKIWNTALPLNVDSTSGLERRNFSGGHSDKVLAVAIAPNQRLAISASFDRTIKVWDISTAASTDRFDRRSKVEYTLIGHSAAVRALAVTPDGRHLVSGSSDHTIKIWDLQNRQIERTLIGHESGVWSLSVTTDGQRLVSASDDHTLRIWNLATGREEFVLVGHGASIWSVAVTADGRYAISASNDRTLRVWDLANGREIRSITGHVDRVRAVAVAADGGFAISASNDRTLKLWDITSGELIRTLIGHSGWVNSVVLTTNGRRAFSAANDRTLRVWEPATGRELASIHLEASLPCVAIAPDGITIVTGDEAGNFYCLEYVEPPAA